MTKSEPELLSFVPRSAVFLSAIQARAAARTAAGSSHVTAESSDQARAKPRSSRLRVLDWLRARGVNAGGDGSAADGQVIYTLDRCLFDDQHLGPDVAVVQDSAGRLSYRCPHESCAQRDISDVAERIGLPESHHYDLAESVRPRLLIDDWLAAAGVVARKKLHACGQIAYFFTCPFDRNHGDAHIVQYAGQLYPRCAGLGCKCHSPSMLEARIGKPAATHYDPPLCVSGDANARNRTDACPASSKLIPFAAYAPSLMSSAALATADFHHEWLVNGVLVRGQPAVLGGPQKSLKTGIAVDLALSLGSGTPFLGTFAVERSARVAMLSGESGAAVLQETAKRICAAKKIDLDKVDVMWDFRLPQLTDPRQVAALCDRLRQSTVAVLVIDPLYLCLLAGPCAEGMSASNLYQIGPLLLDLARTCSDVGVTPILVHHTKKTLAESHQPLGLENLAFAGIGEFARQWLLLSRREVFTPGSGLHRLWLSVGGSAGHSDLWAVDVDEGVLRDDFSGRTWKVSVSDGAAAREGAKEGRQAKQRENEDTRLLDALSELDPDGKGAVYTQVRDRARLSGQQMPRTVARLVQKGVIKECRIKIDGAKNSKQTVRMLWRCSSGPPEPASVVPVIPTNAEVIAATPGSSGQTPNLTSPPDDRKS